MSRFRNILIRRNPQGHGYPTLLVFICSFAFFSVLDTGAQVITNNGAAMNISAGTYVNTQDATNTAGTLTNTGIFTLTGNITNTANLNGNGIYRLGGNWLNNGGVFTAGTSTVYFLGTANQTIVNPAGETFFNLYLSNTGASGSNFLGLSNNVDVLGTLTLSNGIINSGSNRIFLSNPLPAALSYISSSGSRVIGKFERGVNQNGNYLFPLGSALHYNPAHIVTTSIVSSGSVLSEFVIPGSIDSLGLPLPDPPDEVARVYQDGFWRMTSNSGFSVANFNMDLDGTGFTTFPIHDITRIIKRTTGGSWTLDGTHVPAVGTVVYRNTLTGNISSAGTQFALAQSRPRIIKNPRDTAVCEATPYAGSNAIFEVFATSTRTVTYKWYKEPGTLLTGPHYNTTGPGTLIILNVTLADAGKYYCVVTDDYGTSTRSTSATLTVNKRPIASATPSTQPNACSNVLMTNIVLGETNGVIGTSFVWTRNNPSGIVSAIPLSGTIPAVGGVIAGSFLNTNDSPVTVTFTIRPIGPGVTTCGGDTIHATVTVNPVPKANRITNASPEICSGGHTAITLNSYTTLTSGNVTFDYSIALTDATITGSTASGTNVPKGQYLSNTYLNSSDTIKSAIFTVTPRAFGLCPDGVPVQVEAKVHAVPLQGITVTHQLKCSGSPDGALRADLSKGAGPYWVKWTGTLMSDSIQQAISHLWQGHYEATVIDNLGCTNMLTKDLAGSFSSYLLNLVEPVSCNKGSDGKITIEVDESTGIAPFEYWVKDEDGLTVAHSFLSNKGIVDTVSGLKAGTFSAIIVDAQGCTAYDPYTTVDVPEPQALKSVMGKSTFQGGANVSCRGYADGWATAAITGGNPGYTYHWFTTTGIITGPSNTNRIDNIPAGRYYLEILDTKTCNLIDSVDIIDPTGLVLADSVKSFSPDGNFNISCLGGHDGSIKLTVTGGSGSYNFFWTGPGTFSASTKDISSLYAGNYTVSIADVTNSTCVLKIGGQLPVFRLSEPTQLGVTSVSSVSTYGGYNINCHGGTGSVTLNVTGGSIGNYRYNWSTTNGSGIVQGQRDQGALTAGSYHVVVTDSNLCMTATDMTLTEPPALSLSLHPTDLTCITQGSITSTVTGGMPPYTYLWTGGELTPGISNLNAGTYDLTVTDANGCTVSGSATVNLPVPITFTSDVSLRNGYNISCQGASDGWIKLTMTSGTPAYTYQWTTPNGSSSTKDLSGLVSGNYSVLITDQNSCTATGNFVLNEPGKLSLNIATSVSSDGSYNINCAGGRTGTIDVEPVNNAGPVTYLWSDGSMEKNRTGLPADTFKVIIIDQNNCPADTTVILTAPDSVRTGFNVIRALCPDSPDGQITVIATGGIAVPGYTYHWSDGSTGQTVNNILEGWWEVTVTDGNNCSVKDSVKMEPRRNTCLVIPNIFSPNGDNINDTWEIGETQLYPEMEIKIFNRWGILIWKSARGYPDRWDGRSDGVLLPIDSYHYFIDLHNGRKPIMGNVTIVK
jgi:gliding motility-associated-like protein